MFDVGQRGVCVDGMAHLLATLVLVIGYGAGLASAQNPADCNKAYDNMLQGIERQGSQLPAERLLALRRRAQRILDACRMGHIEDPRSLFDRLDRSRD